MAMKMYSQYVEPEYIERMKEVAEKKGISLAQAVRDAIKRYLKEAGCSK